MRSNRIFGSAIGCVTIIFFLCICLSLIQMPDVSDQGSSSTTSPTNPNPLITPPVGPSVTPGGPTVTPSQATCPNAGVSYPNNPFSGWPQNRSWGDINYYYCDPVYEPLGRYNSLLVRSRQSSLLGQVQVAMK